jgi:hypothetical protein
MVLIFLSFSIPARAGLLETINESYVDSVNDLPAAQGSPAIAWQQQGNIRAWVDIVGFRDLAFINGAFYVPGDPANYAIVQYDAKGTPPGIFDSIKKTVSVSGSGNNIIASLHVILKWHTIYCDNKGCYVNGRFTEEKDFTDSEISPRPFYSDAESVRVHDIEYNHSIIVQRLLYLNTSPLITKYNVSIPNGSINHRLQIAQIYYTKKGIPYANYSVFDTWNTQGKGINLQYEAVIIDDLNKPYSIQAYTPFGLLATTPTITKSNNTWSPEKTFPSFTFLIIFIFGVLFTGLFFMRS